jgi:hypothetical protein
MKNAQKENPVYDSSLAIALNGDGIKKYCLATLKTGDNKATD